MTHPHTPKFLAIDDDPDFLRLLTSHLSNLNIGLFVSLTVHDALDIVRKESPDFLLLDLELKGGTQSGLSLLKELYEHPQLRRLPAMIITSHQSDLMELECRRLGIFDYQVKPIKPAKIRSVIRWMADHFDRGMVRTGHREGRLGILKFAPSQQESRLEHLLDELLLGYMTIQVTDSSLDTEWSRDRFRDIGMVLAELSSLAAEGSVMMLKRWASRLSVPVVVVTETPEQTALCDAAELYCIQLDGSYARKKARLLSVVSALR